MGVCDSLRLLGRSVAETAGGPTLQGQHPRENCCAVLLFDESDFLCTGIVGKEVAMSML